MTIKRFYDLDQKEINDLYIYCKSFQPEQYYETIEEMKDYYGGSHLAHGDHHLSFWEDDRVLASMGYIDRVLEDKGEIYITHGFVAQEHLGSFEKLLSYALFELKKKQNEEVLALAVVKLGVRGDNNALDQWTTSMKWETLYHMLKMNKDLVADESIEINGPSRLSHEDMTETNWGSFLEIHNLAFKTVPNGGPLEEEEMQSLIDAYDKGNGKLWLFSEKGSPVAIAMIERKHNGKTMILEAVGVSPDRHGQGYGRETLQAIFSLLKKEGIQNLELMVMDANVSAYGLYKALGFTLISKVVTWRTKMFGDLFEDFRESDHGIL